MIFNVIKGRIILVKKQDKGIKTKQKMNFGSNKNHDFLPVLCHRRDPFYKLPCFC